MGRLKLGLLRLRWVDMGLGCQEPGWPHLDWPFWPWPFWLGLWDAERRPRRPRQKPGTELSHWPGAIDGLEPRTCS